MAYCTKCGFKNTDDALFCGGCGAPLKKADDNTSAPPRWERIHLQRDNAPQEESTPPRRESTPPRQKIEHPRWENTRPRRERSAGVWGDMAERKRKAEQPEKQEPEKKKKKGGCLKRLLLWTVGIMVALVGAIWLFAKYFDGDSGDGGESDNQNPATFERIMSQASADSLQGAIGFPKTTEDVAPLAGDYEAMAQNFPIAVSLQPAQNGKMVGKAKIKLAGHTKVDGVYAYCGNSIYGIYEDEEDIGGKARNYFYALEDRKSIMMIDGGEYILKRKEVKPGKKASKGLLSKEYERSFDDERFERLRERHKFPHSTIDVSIENGTYETVKEDKGIKVFIFLEIESVNSDNKQIIGRVTMGGRVEGQEERRQDLVLTYAGYSTYAVYEKEEDIGDLDAMALFASPDGKTLDMYDHGEVFFSFKKK